MNNMEESKNFIPHTSEVDPSDNDFDIEAVNEEEKKYVDSLMKEMDVAAINPINIPNELHTGEAAHFTVDTPAEVVQVEFVFPSGQSVVFTKDHPHDNDYIFNNVDLSACNGPLVIRTFSTDNNLLEETNIGNIEINENPEI